MGDWKLSVAAYYDEARDEHHSGVRVDYADGGAELVTVPEHMSRQYLAAGLVRLALRIDPTLKTLLAAPTE